MLSLYHCKPIPNACITKCQTFTLNLAIGRELKMKKKKKWATTNALTSEMRTDEIKKKKKEKRKKADHFVGCCFVFVLFRVYFTRDSI